MHPTHAKLIQAKTRHIIPEIDESSSSSNSRGKGDFIVLEQLDTKNDDLDDLSDIDYETKNPSIVISMKNDENTDRDFDENPYQNMQRPQQDSLSVHYRNDSEESNVNITKAKYEVEFRIFISIG